MVEVSGIGAARAVAPVRGRATRGGFTMGDASPVAEGPASLAGAVGVGAPGGMLWLQEVPSDAARDRAAAAHGAEIITVLAALQRAMLGGGEDQAALARLIKLAESAPEPADSRLAGVMSAILLRAKVELARRQLAGS